MNFDQLAANMTPDIYSRLREAIELGRWPTGQKLTVEQKNLSLELNNNVLQEAFYYKDLSTG